MKNFKAAFFLRIYLLAKSLGKLFFFLREYISIIAFVSKERDNYGASTTRYTRYRTAVTSTLQFRLLYRGSHFTTQWWKIRS